MQHLSRCILISLILLGFFATGFAEEKVSLALIPIANRTDTKLFSAVDVENVSQIANRTLKVFIELLPFVNLSAGITETQISDPSAIAQKYKVKMVIYGDFTLTGKRSAPGIVFNLKVWSEDLKKEIFSKTYTSADTGFEMLDTVDLILKEVVGAAFQINATVATLGFSGFEIAEPYALAINDKSIAVVSNTNFSISMKILADKPYRITLKRERDGKLAIDREYNIKPGESTNIGYIAKASVSTLDIKDPDRTKKYSIMLDGAAIGPNTNIGSLSVLQQHKLMMIDQYSNVIQSNIFTLMEDDNTAYGFTDPRPKPIYFSIITAAGGYYWGGGIYCFLDRYNWLGASAAFTVFSGSIFSGFAAYTNPLMSLFGNLEYGYYLIGERAYDFRIGLGANLQGMFFFPQDTWNSATVQGSTTSSPYCFSAGIFGVIEYSIFYAKMAVNYNFFGNTGIEFVPEIGIKF